MFVGFALLQLNDPDGLLWFVVYGFVAFLHWQASKKIFYTRLLLVLMGGSCVSVYLLWPSEYQGVEGVMRTELPQIEQARESLGMLIVSLSLLAVYLFARSVQNDESDKKEA